MRKLYQRLIVAIIVTTLSVSCSKRADESRDSEEFDLPLSQKPEESFERLERRDIGQPIVGQPWITHVQAIDANLDGRVDVLVCDAFENTVSLIENLGNGKFDERTLAKIQSPVHTDAIDMDGDGDLDILIASMGYLFPNNEKIGSVIILENTGGSSYETHVIAEGIARVTDVRAADFDGDGNMDLAVAQFGYMQGEARWMRNIGDWQFESESLLELPGSINVCVSDFDANGTQDIAILISQESEEIRLLSNDGKGNFESSIIFGSTNKDYGSSNIRICDLNKDGRIDILYTNGDGFDLAYPGPRPWHGVQWLENLGNGNFAYHRLADLPGAYSPVAADIDGDGDEDIVAVSCFSKWTEPDAISLLLLRNEGEGQFTPIALAKAPTHLVSLDAADFDGDGSVELTTGGFHVYPPFDHMSRISIWR